MRWRSAVAVLIILAGCGSASPTPGFQAVPDEPAATEAAATTTTTPLNLHVIDQTARNPFEPFEQP